MSITAGQLAEQIGARVLGDESLELDGVAKIEEAGPREVTFVANPAYRKYLAKTRAGAVILAGEPREGGT
ncbi:MAG TPA: UDP-3-O-(3-hydroxymyristoyl)glucosamine N-acyltransferase, partial [Bacteroidetes bacterium]|nr:UDP-3-O-(3-hydroxymyristoyl)glucosamine N-acyltransferase [Bacteroidota bacterium]